MDICKEVEELLRTPTEDGKITLDRQTLLRLLDKCYELDKECDEMARNSRYGY